MPIKKCSLPYHTTMYYHISLGRQILYIWHHKYYFHILYLTTYHICGIIYHFYVPPMTSWPFTYYTSYTYTFLQATQHAEILIKIKQGFLATARLVRWKIFYQNSLFCLKVWKLTTTSLQLSVSFTQNPLATPGKIGEKWCCL